MARPKTPESVLRAIFEAIVRGEKPKAVVKEIQAAHDYLVSASLVADMKGGWAHGELGKEYGITPKTRAPKSKVKVEEEVAA